VSIHVALNHVSHYLYEHPVSLGPQIVRLRPAPHCRTRILSYSLRVTPTEHFINWQQDPQANYLARLVFPQKTSELRIEVDLIAEMAVLNPFDFFSEQHAEHFPFDYQRQEVHELAPFLHRLPAGPLFSRYLATIDIKKQRTIDFLVNLNRQLSTDIRYLIRLEPGIQTPEETLAKASGSCRDSAWLLVQILRHLGLAARFVSGYLIQLTPDVKSLDGPSGPAADFTDLHAWCEVYLPGAGWIGLDPTSGLLAGEGHIPLACAPEPTSAAPISGEVEPCESKFAHQMHVSRIWEAPRVTKPYTEQQWQAIDALGLQIDADLARLDVRLTMGGEPTFVAIDAPEGAEWNTDALGPSKRRFAVDLFQRLQQKYGPAGLVHFGQGKWYPGEQLPRWSLNCFWRRDGEAIWQNPALIANEREPGHATAADTGPFLIEIAERLGVNPQWVFPAFEDVFYYLWRERQLPVNVDPFDSRLEDPLERARLARIFSQGLDTVVGHILPIGKDPSGQSWQSSPWFERSARCYLVPGDSPLGYRLPLDSLPWVKSADYPWLHQPDPQQRFTPLLGAAAIRQQVARRSLAEATPITPPQTGESARTITRTALCAEVRNGILYLFMPPTDSLEDYLALVGAIEATAASRRCPVLLEGYPPPQDPRLNHFSITPDPGVIEVNIHPAGSWDELVERTTHLYEQARLSRLATEKFMKDGRHVGTGGGNHFVLGGATPLDSPWLRRPDLLKSMIAYWHNHPSLSYLFSGLFIGPTSQAPRVDEARNDALYELEVAFSQFPPAGQECPPWLVDRLLRNLLVDVSGNTHRAEFCIDKLYSPEGPAGRLGLLEMRAFEMPPHAQMSLAQQLLLRALIARFWQTPYEPARLARWGTELHDRFLLPWFVEQDFADVVTELNDAGYQVETGWFAPHFEFRFPKAGDFTVKGIELELRHALEPWHVLGEQNAPGGTARYVDSSLERLQVKVSGLAPDRYGLTCNGKRVPLTSTGRVGEYIGAVRYRAWQPPSCLHPTIRVHAPLTFDLIDSWMNRSLGGCQYHVQHPGGTNPDAFPVNAFEAESRRLARFFRMGHTPGTCPIPAPSNPSAEHPYTLDLRRP